MQILDTLSGKKEEINKTAEKIKFFVCGPTVYDDAHIGHARTCVFFDLMVRYLRSEDWNIFYLQNVTDIDDKIIKRANELGMSAKSLADKFTKSYLKDMKDLGAISVDKYAKATKFIPQIVKQVKTLIAKGYAYKIDDGYYFDILKFNGYGKLSRRSVEGAEQSVSRIDEGLGKKNKGDFCLWKFKKEGEPFWKTDLGDGRPGWHIEDTAISEKFFGPQYDIHGGGVDLKFPHHEAELTQQEAASGLVPFVKIWMHAGMLTVDGVKMSKSLNNFITIKEYLSKHSARIFRFMVLTHHYRSTMNYTDVLIEQSKQALETIDSFRANLDFIFSKNSKGSESAGSAPISGVGELIIAARAKFTAAMGDDFNTPAAIAAVFELISTFNKNIWSLTSLEAEKLNDFIRDSLMSFGLTMPVNRVPTRISLMLMRRDKFRVDKQFIQSDTLRKKIESLGYKVDDTPLGSRAKKVQK